MSFELNGNLYFVGNRTLNNLNISSNKISDVGLKEILETLMEQDLTSQESPDGLQGLYRVNIEFNDFRGDSAIAAQIASLCNSRNPDTENDLPSNANSIIRLDAIEVKVN